MQYSVIYKYSAYFINVFVLIMDHLVLCHTDFQKKVEGIYFQCLCKRVVSCVFQVVHHIAVWHVLSFMKNYHKASGWRSLKTVMMKCKYLAFPSQRLPSFSCQCCVLLIRDSLPRPATSWWNSVGGTGRTRGLPSPRSLCSSAGCRRPGR